MLTFTDDNRTYEWVGGLGAIFKSHEDGLHLGDVRFIKGRLYHVALLYPCWRPWKDEISWSLACKFDFSDVAKIRQEIFR